VTEGGTASTADLGGSSKFQVKSSLEGRSWRRVPCQQHLDMGKPILRHGGNLLAMLTRGGVSGRVDGRGDSGQLGSFLLLAWSGKGIRRSRAERESGQNSGARMVDRMSLLSFVGCGLGCWQRCPGSWSVGGRLRGIHKAATPRQPMGHCP